VSTAVGAGSTAGGCCADGDSAAGAGSEVSRWTGILGTPSGCGAANICSNDIGDVAATGTEAVGTDEVRTGEGGMGEVGTGDIGTGDIGAGDAFAGAVGTRGSARLLATRCTAGTATPQRSVG